MSVAAGRARFRDAKRTTPDTFDPAAALAGETASRPPADLSGLAAAREAVRTHTRPEVAGPVNLSQPPRSEDEPSVTEALLARRATFGDVESSDELERRRRGQ